MSPKTPFRIATLGLAALMGLALVTAGCGGANRVTPGSQEEAGTISDLSKEKPSVYQVKAGDTLSKIAAKPEIYGDKNLWPLLLASNQDVLVAGKAPKPGIKLLIRRDLSEADLQAARQQALASQKAAKPAVKAKAAKATAKPVAAAAKPAATAAKPAVAPAKPAAVAAKPTAVAVKPAAVAVKPEQGKLTATPVPTQTAAQPQPAKKAGSFWTLVLIFLCFAFIALVVLLWVMRREHKD